MQIGCGIDIIEIERIKKSLENPKTGEIFKNKIYTEKEILYCESKKNQKYQHYAARFAAKEALFKAISEKIGDKFFLNWKNIEIVNNKQGKPNINLVEIDGDRKDIESIDLSISHCKEYAVADVIIIFKE